MKNILQVNNLHTYFKTSNGEVKAVNGVSFSIKEGKTIGIIGESGSGKSQTAMSILRLFEKNQFIHNGQIIFDEKDLTKLSDDEIRSIRGNEISMIFQEPMTSLNPVFTVKKQIAETLILHRGFNKKQAEDEVINLLKAVKIPNAQMVANNYPHELSGGMRQRVMIAIALACRPKLLIADEATTALDVTIQAQILRLLNEIKQENNTSIMFITHDLGVVKQIADDIAVMYCGQVVELVSVEEVFNEKSEFSHPYTTALLKTIPSLSSKKSKRLPSIQGSVPHPQNLPLGCKFSPRCEFAKEECIKQEPELLEVGPNHSVRCFYPKKGRCSDE